jgi:murein DD-endopeptidase MepM/ murein hydrolase activator NlpD
MFSNFGSDYTVVSGDTLDAIAKRYGTTYQILAAQNGIPDPNKIEVGQIIHIPDITLTAPSLAESGITSSLFAPIAAAPALPQIPMVSTGIPASIAAPTSTNTVFVPTVTPKPVAVPTVKVQPVYPGVPAAATSNFLGIDTNYWLLGGGVFALGLALILMRRK